MSVPAHRGPGDVTGLSDWAGSPLSTLHSLMTVAQAIRAGRHDQAEGRRPSEFRYGLFSRHVTLPSGAGEDDVAASYQNGILGVGAGLRGEREHSARKIPVATAGRATPAAG